MKITFDTDKVKELIRKNENTSYGLTLVAGLPLPKKISRALLQCQKNLETALPGRFAWYKEENMHVTLRPLLRGRYRDHPHLQFNEIPQPVDDFFHDLQMTVALWQPICLHFLGSYLTESGALYIDVAPITLPFARLDDHYPDLFHPNPLERWHISVGYWHSAEQEYSSADRKCLSHIIGQLGQQAIGKMIARRVWLVHYSNRQLNRFIGKVTLPLGVPPVHNTESILRALHISSRSQGE